MQTLRQIAHITQRVTLKPHSILKVDRYNALPGTVSEKSRSNLMQENDLGYQYNGYLSPASRREVKKRLEVWLSAIELSKNHKESELPKNHSEILPTFVTLTLPSKQVHSDQDMKKYLLERFLKWITQPYDEYYKYGPLKGEQKSFGVEHYFWRAEVQKNGNIHFHILLDRFVPWPRIRLEWNKILETLGYVTRYDRMQRFFYRKGFRLRPEQLNKDVERYRHYAQKLKESGTIPKDCPEALKNIFKISLKRNKAIDNKILRKAAELNQKEKYDHGMENGFNDPNSTDIHGIKNLASITAYVIKYVTKKPEEKKIELAAPEKMVLHDGLEFTIKEKIEVENGQKIRVKYYLDDTIPEFTSEVYLERTPVVTEFVERRLRGNIWGTDKGLKPKKGESPVDYFVTQESETYRYMLEDGSGSTLEPGEHIKTVKGLKKIFKTMWQTDAFGEKKRVHLFCRDYVEPVKISAKDRFPKPDIQPNKPVKEYLDKVRELSDKRQMQRIKANCGEFFEQINGEIIPIDQQLGKDKKYLRQDQVLKALSPELHRQYLDHYKNVYNYLYEA